MWFLWVFVFCFGWSETSEAVSILTRPVDCFRWNSWRERLRLSGPWMKATSNTIASCFGFMMSFFVFVIGPLK